MREAISRRGLITKLLPTAAATTLIKTADRNSNRVNQTTKSWPTDLHKALKLFDQIVPARDGTNYDESRSISAQHSINLAEDLQSKIRDLALFIRDEVHNVNNKRSWSLHSEVPASKSRALEKPTANLLKHLAKFMVEAEKNSNAKSNVIYNYLRLDPLNTKSITPSPTAPAIDPK